MSISQAPGNLLVGEGAVETFYRAFLEVTVLCLA